MRSATLAVAAAALTGLALPASASAEETDCRGAIGAQTVDNLRVPEGAACELTGTFVKGTVKVERDATLRARSIRVIGYVQGENAARVVVDRSELGGSLQVKQGGGAELTESRLGGDVQLDANDGATQRVVANDVNGSVQVISNRGGVDIPRNLIVGNLQCKENVPAPSGAGNVVQGNAEDQCASLAGGAPGGAGPGSGGGGDDGAGDDRSSVPAAIPVDRTLRASRRGVVRVPLRCASSGRACRGRMTLRARGFTLATERFAIASGQRRAVRVRLSRRGRAMLRRAESLRVRVVASTPGGKVRLGATLRQPG